ncbi:acyl-CoA dehydrogenase [Streptomyces sp. NPDC001843]|uniref:acyl-CoA dehydrogenase n=1 Tax=Streptomyces sp. NPDC001843 TaxID=3364617 RepID=UPI0036C34544
MVNLAAAPVREAEVQRRVAAVEDLLGDPGDPANPCGYAALLEADRDAVRSVPGEDALDRSGMHHEYVPVALGGRLTSMDTLVRVMRPVFRRDVGLGMGYGAMSFMAAVDVWMAGTEDQRSALARRMLRGSRAAIAQLETAHSNDYVRSQVTARPGPRGGLLLSGRKPVINNLDRADALVLFARTDPDPGRRSHTAVLLDPSRFPEGRARRLGRHTSLGLRGCVFGGVDFDDCPVPDGALLGPAGDGVPIALRSFQVTRTVISSMVLAAVDTSLRTAVAFDHEHRGGGWSTGGSDSQRTTATITGAFVNLLLYDAFATVATRAIHVLPEQTSVYSAAVKYLLPRLLTETMYDLSIVLGAGLYTREGTLGIFQKHLRDVPVVTLGHAGSVACQGTIIPQLPHLARRSWFVADEAPATLFRPRDPLPPFDPDRLALACGQDSLSATLLAVATETPGTGAVERTLRDLALGLVDEFRDLRARVLALGPEPGAAPFPLMDRYAHLLAAAAVLGVWRHNQDGSDPFLADPAWAAAALHRLARRLGAPAPDLPAECELRVRHEVQLRFSDRRSYDLYDTPLPG